MTVIPIEIVITGLDPVIHLLRKDFLTKIDGCPDQVRSSPGMTGGFCGPRKEALRTHQLQSLQTANDNAVVVVARSEATKQSILSLRCEMDCFAPLAMTAERNFAISRREAPELCIYLPPPRRAWGMPGARCTRSLVCTLYW
jgi:hypothetical protein